MFSRVKLGNSSCVNHCAGSVASDDAPRGSPLPHPLHSEEPDDRAAAVRRSAG